MHKHQRQEETETISLESYGTSRLQEGSHRGRRKVLHSHWDRAPETLPKAERPVQGYKSGNAGGAANPRHAFVPLSLTLYTLLSHFP
jgi:hypothetical protein